MPGRTMTEGLASGQDKKSAFGLAGLVVELRPVVAASLAGLSYAETKRSASRDCDARHRMRRIDGLGRLQGQPAADRHTSARFRNYPRSEVFDAFLALSHVRSKPGGYGDRGRAAPFGVMPRS